MGKNTDGQFKAGREDGTDNNYVPPEEPGFNHPFRDQDKYDKEWDDFNSNKEAYDEGFDSGYNSSKK